MRVGKVVKLEHTSTSDNNQQDEQYQNNTCVVKNSAYLISAASSCTADVVVAHFFISFNVKVQYPMIKEANRLGRAVK